ncbi:unnamed protein product [Trifolium pratense]|uniref:Uncharacterized protein n=1 Tax=Trifolium pratense TaxID=57577 RepID=A0ACB0LAD6_TRIPR|nr:unnamed protein product [Trifolium pratense]
MSSSFLSLSLYLISLGQGGYNPSLQAFGADQLGEDEELPCSNSDDTSSKKKALFFQWWYFGVCAGSLMGVTVMSYIQDTFGWVIGFAIPAISMLLSILIFSSGRSIYSYKQHDDDDDIQDKKPFMNMFQSIKASAMKCFHCEITLPNDKSEVVELELQERPLCRENCEGIKVSKISMCLLPNIKVMIKLLPIWTMLLMFAVIFQQPATFFTKQGMTMQRNIGSNFKIPPATLQSAITLSIILLMPLYDRIFIPFAQLITRQEKGINVMQRMGIGMVLSIIAMVIAALVEMKRLAIGRQMRSEGLQSEIVPISIFWLLPQYILLGISDIFTVVGMQEFFYGEVPKNMRTVGIALYTSVFGVGSFVSALMITLVEVYTSSKGTSSWFSDDMVEARLDNYYWLLALLSSISFLLYTLLCKYYYRKSNPDIEN